MRRVAMLLPLLLLTSCLPIAAALLVPRSWNPKWTVVEADTLNPGLAYDKVDPDDVAIYFDFAQVPDSYTPLLKIHRKKVPEATEELDAMTELKYTGALRGANGVVRLLHPDNSVTYVAFYSPHLAATLAARHAAAIQ